MSEPVAVRAEAHLPKRGDCRSAETAEARRLPKRGDCRSAATSEARRLPKRGDCRSAETAEARRLPKRGDFKVQANLPCADRFSARLKGCDDRLMDAAEHRRSVSAIGKGRLVRLPATGSAGSVEADGVLRDIGSSAE